MKKSPLSIAPTSKAPYLIPKRMPPECPTAGIHDQKKESFPTSIWSSLREKSFLIVSCRQRMSILFFLRYSFSWSRRPLRPNPLWFQIKHHIRTSRSRPVLGGQAWLGECV